MRPGTLTLTIIIIINHHHHQPSSSSTIITFIIINHHHHQPHFFDFPFLKLLERKKDLDSIEKALTGLLPPKQLQVKKFIEGTAKAKTWCKKQQKPKLCATNSKS
jgi:hypothetical protein